MCEVARAVNVLRKLLIRHPSQADAKNPSGERRVEEVSQISGDLAEFDPKLFETETESRR